MAPEIIAEFEVSQPLTARYFGYKAARHFSILDDRQRGPTMNNLQGRRTRFATIATFGLLAALLPVAFGPAVAETPEERQACTHDAFRLCNDAIPDVAKVTACLARNRSSLSPLCRSAMSGGGGTVRRTRRYNRG